MADDYSPDLLNAVTAYLDSKHFTYDVDKDNPGEILVKWKFSTTTAIKKALINISALSDTICVTTLPEIPDGSGSIIKQLPTDDTDRLADAMIFLAAANFNRMHYTLQLNPATGTVQSMSSLYCGEFIPPMELIDMVFTHSHHAWEINGDEFINVLEHHKDPLAAAADAYRHISGN